MGAFFTNVQVHCGALAAEAARSRVIEHLRVRIGAGSTVATGTSETDVRWVLVAPPAEGPWIAVYDSATESQDDRDLRSFTKLLSTALPGAAVGVRVHDGDLLDLWLVENGPERDHVCNWPKYFEGKPPPKRARGKPAAWRSLLVAGATPAALRAAWTNAPQPDGPTLLRGMAPLLGWDRDAVTVGFRSLPEALRARCTELIFAAPPRPAEPPRPPAFGHAGGTPDPLHARVGDTISIVAIAHNTGGPLHGLSVVLFGPAIEKELIRPEGLTVVVGNPRSALRIRAPLAPVSTAGQRMWTAQLPDVELPAGYADMAAAYRAAPDAEQAIAAWMAARVEAQTDALVVKRGRGDLHIGLVPAENPEGGQTSWTVEVHARA